MPCRRIGDDYVIFLELEGCLFFFMSIVFPKQEKLGHSSFGVV